MRRIATTFESLGGRVLVIGHKGDSKATTVIIDCREAMAEFAGTYAALSITSPEGVMYPGDIQVQNGIISWLVRARDTKEAGSGSVRVDLLDDQNTVVATAECNTMVLKTNLPGIPPGQIEDWIDAASVLLQDVQWALDAFMTAGRGILHFDIGNDGCLYLYVTDDTPVMFEIINGELWVYGR